MPATSDATDLLYGVPAIATAFGWKPRQVYHLKDQHELPTFKIGRTVCASRAAVRSWLAAREAAALAAQHRPPQGR
ncbi:hypothetical protein [Methylorubrum extorquens]|uniref:Helix-turn-helix domain-containing protein n=1 Tax=Methylorubrum extorquens DSM 13060 TaxID=882800 RepID=H1KG83_METEX|nr:hypothetical protein [Methylorubrum extorquens]EHP93424.1 hypothetical protein MetexDRAFT_1645 [Methylorubrum extorquens DSM 13060]